MAEFLLVHGSCHGAWCWEPVIDALAALGHSARAIDLPSAGDDQTPVADVTLDDCRDAVLAAATPDSIVVGHSWGGFPISAAAEADPGALRALVFLCAYVPEPGLSMNDMARRSPRRIPTGVVIADDDRTYYTFDPEMAPDLFYQDCSSDDVFLALGHQTAQSIAPQATPLPLSDRFAGVEKYYIRCANDRVIPPEYQAAMTEGWPEGHVSEMDTGHSPFLADPKGLARKLDEIAARM
jgi:pimeloyl-ACP methyl ester carboxylesterase